jgi:hypothetical protein
MSIPTLDVGCDFQANPLGSYSDIHSTLPGVVSFWRTNSTSTFLDERGANDGTMVSTPATTAGPYSYDSDLGLTFDGASDSAFVPSSASLSFNGPLAVDGWVKVASLPGSTVDLVGKHGSWLFQLGSDGKVRFHVKNDASLASLTSSTVLATGTWYYVLGSYDGATAALYINGVLDTSTAYTAGVEVTDMPIRFAGGVSTTVATFGTAATNSGNASTLVGTKPASTASGDLLLAHVATHDGVNPNQVDYPDDGTGSNFELLSAEEPTSGLGTWSQVWMKVATGSEPASYSWESRNAGSLDAMPYVIGIIRIPTGTFDATVPLCNAVYSNVQLSASATHATASHIPAIANALRVDFFGSRANGTWTADSGSERFDAAGTNMSIACYTQTASFPTALTVTGTNTISQVGATHTVFVQGTGVTETACSLDDWAVWNEGVDAETAAFLYESRNGGTGTYSPLASAVREFTCTAGNRQYERDQMQAGSASLTLNDTTRRFDPDNGSSDLSPNVLPLKRLRIQAVWSATTYPVFEGYADGWPQEQLAPRLMGVPLNCVDGFDLLSQAELEGTIPIGFTGEQIDAILDIAAWPVAKRDIDTGQYVVVEQELTGDALSAIQALADSERGVFFVDVDGVATFHDSIHRATDTRSITSQATFTDNAGGIVYQDMSRVFDRTRIINRWSVTPDSSVAGAAVQTVTDSVSRHRYGLRAASRSTQLLTNDAALEQARFLLADTAWPTRNFESVTVDVTASSSPSAALIDCLELRVSDLVTVKRGTGPTWTGAQITQECFIEGKTVSAPPGQPWLFTFKLSPRTSGNYLGAVVLSDPVSLWRMDVNS